MTSIMQTEVLVIGGGATGAGVARDLAMRGFKTVLVEKGDLATGTTGRYHGLLHSGGRYVVKDPLAARECIEENRILRRILPHCIEDTSGFFVVTPWDDPSYAARFVAGCRQADIPVEEVPVSQMLRKEPLLNPKITQCFQVPDGSADSFLAADANAASARQYGATILHYHKVLTLLKSGARVTGARCHNLAADEEVEILADMVVNASGAWAGQIAATIGLQVAVVPGKGVMIAVNHRIVNTVINRCKMPSDGDILVPAHTVAVIGTTDVKVQDPDHFAIEPWEIQLMVEEGEKIIPGFSQMRMLRAWGGVRPLYQESVVSDTRDVTRAFVLLDHADRDGIAGLVTITSGKWTTYRKMAETTVDLVCRKLGVERPCRTHLESMAGASESGHHYLGARLAEIEHARAFGQLVCECELATYDDVAQAILKNEAKTIDDVRRDVRLGMGPCQGGFCTYRVAGILHRLRQSPVEKTNLALRDFLQERWKGLRPILWGQQLRQERLDELIYLSLLNTDHASGPQSGLLSPENYETALTQTSLRDTPDESLPAKQAEKPLFSVPMPVGAPTLDLLVVGAGLSGLTAAWQAAAGGKRVRLISKGWGALYWHAGCIDILGYYPSNNSQPVASPAAGIEKLINEHPQHPYALLGLENIAASLKAFQELCIEAEYPLHGSLEENWLLPSSLGIARPTCLAPETMIVGDLQRDDPMLIIGFEGFPDFYPGLIADNVSATGIPATSAILDLPELRQRSFVTGRVLAELFEQPDFVLSVTEAIKTSLRRASKPLPARVGFPAVLGLNNPLQVKRRLEELLGLPIFEIPTLPPSIPGIRLSRLLTKAIQKLQGQVYDGMQAISSSRAEDGRLQAVYSEASARPKGHFARQYVLATGGILGGGLVAHYEGSVEEVVCSLPVAAPVERTEWLNPRFLGPEPHPIYQAGLSVNPAFHPLDSAGRVIFSNLFIAGTILAGGDYLHQRSFDGVALASGFFVGRQAALH
jgi:glycerol-3-phosphate dehydrogenase